MAAPGAGLLQALKNTTCTEGATLCLAVGLPVEAILRPVTTAKGAARMDDVRVLTLWRNRHVDAFLTEFDATESRTRDWLTTQVGPDETRILFMLDDAHDGHTLGYMGLAYIDWAQRYGEADAIVRGAATASGLMTRAMCIMLDWARHQLRIERIGVRVRSDNSALNFYRKFGFREVRRVPLRKEVTPDMVQWLEDPSLPSTHNLSLVHMELTG